MFESTTQSIIDAGDVPRHIAIIMDGNGRWAKKRFMPRVMGHKKGFNIVREIVKSCSDMGVEYLTLFAFSTENWRRPQEEVGFLMNMFLTALKGEIKRIHKNNLRLKVIGSRSRFSAEIVKYIEMAEELTQNNTGLTLTIAADYGGRQEILQAANTLIAEGVQEITEEKLLQKLYGHYMPEPDLFIRTGGEIRISNFLLWQLAYTELYFTDLLWPDFDAQALNEAISSYRKRERRFGRTSEQLPQEKQRV